MRRKLNLKRDTLASLSQSQLGDLNAGVQTLQSGCQSGVAPCYPTYRCTHTTSLDCLPTDACETLVC